MPELQSIRASNWNSEGPCRLKSLLDLMSFSLVPEISSSHLYILIENVWTMHLLQGNMKSSYILRITQCSNIRLVPYSLGNDLFIPVIPRVAICVADLLLLTCEYQCLKHYQMTQQKVELLYSSFAVEPMVDIQQHSQVSEAAWLTIISCGVEESRGIVLMHGSFQLQGRLRY